MTADRLPTLATLDPDGRVIGLGGVPAEIAPGSALGYLVVPPALHGPVAAVAVGTPTASPVTPAVVAARNARLVNRAWSGIGVVLPLSISVREIT